MRIGCFADIHSNLPALQAVLGSMPKVDMLVCAGDVVGYYRDPNEVCQIIRETGVHVVRGNHDAYVTGDLIPNRERQPLYRSEWTRRQLTDRNFNWLRCLPVELRFRYGSTTLIIRHASPWDEETYLYTNSSQLLQIELTEKVLAVFGHTHHPLWKQVDRGWILNPGSVGQPRDYDPDPSFAIIDTAALKATFFRARYDVVGYQAKLLNDGWDADTVSILSRERSK